MPLTPAAISTLHTAWTAAGLRCHQAEARYDQAAALHHLATVSFRISPNAPNAAEVQRTWGLCDAAFAAWATAATAQDTAWAAYRTAVQERELAAATSILPLAPVRANAPEEVWS